FQYSFSLDDKIQENDHIFEKEGVEVVVDDLSVGFLQEAQLDFVEDLVSSQFVVKNPNTSTSCGCGHSFSV
ncbi:MAG: iron-sulfur cluster assembly accessory protein, partial [Proteobacteria bacterium]|nr:iron-sulfur cluster assembly accessory protein [Pseudomonadota bacterium]